ncbi:DNA-3-methyladenine glycosidase [Polymorphobacter multimanifer]|uniref:DNA-3-methyladenine glycosylase II n=1 Tax=Polymorphobacter multimanifer TaxID=1070431 RepID=A0A841L2J8_9SPHN|nr:DNA-3-methyladenine glycosylase 2 family protein [Polymorphobacter multimanifer]MBB6227039.1 DNA-3-methyladenine glycosylase II [Polymorphobacter multimanifer]GGI87199.1 DNA-3-methyladenine glycosidase [Polymorphobacter multimanifer]
MGLSAPALAAAIEALAAADPRLAAAIDRIGAPEPRIRPRGPATLLRAIIGQQVSVKAAASIWNRLEAAAGGDANDLARLAALSPEELRAAGLSGQKASYVHALAAAVIAGHLDFASLPEDDEQAVLALTAIKGIGRWTAEIYLLFAEGRPDVFPGGDLAVQIEMGRLLGLPARPPEKATRLLAEPFRPHRGALAILCWHSYNITAL